MNFIHPIAMSIYAAAGMFWDIFWALVLGFTLSGIVIAFLPKNKIARSLGQARVPDVGRAVFFGAISSSCSFAAASTSRSLFQKGAHIISALAFMLASTNLVIELSAILWVLMGWQFVLAEGIGGIVLVSVMALLMRVFAPLEAFEKKRLEIAGSGRVETEDNLADPWTIEGWRRVAQITVSEWKMIWKDIALGVLVSGFIMELVPTSFWDVLFMHGTAGFSGHPTFFQLVENALVGPIVSMLSFVCSVGNIPLASVLYQGGISFGGAISFIYADLIIVPLILIYRRYYGWRLALWITGIFYVSMVVTGVLVELAFDWIGLTPSRQSLAQVNPMHFFETNYTFWLNLVFLLLAGALVFLSKTGAGKKGEPGADCCHED